MHNLSKYKTLINFFSIFSYLFILLFSGCYSVKNNKKIINSKKTLKDSQKPILVWPLPPDEPRIQFVKTIKETKHLILLADRRNKADARKSFSKTISYWTKFIYKTLVGLPTFLNRFFEGNETVRVGIKRPYGITVDESGRIYIADRGLGTVHLFDYNKNEYRQITKAGKYTLISPIGLASDSKNNIYISDSFIKKIFKFSKNGKFIGEIGADYKFSRPTGMAINKKAKLLYIVDTHAHKILAFSLDGIFQFEFGNKEKAEDKLHFPTNIFIDKNEMVYICDAMNFKIKTYSKSGELLNQFGKLGDKIGYFSKPKGVAVDSDGHIYQVESFYDRIQIFNKAGELLLFFGNKGSGKGEFWLPSGIHIDKNDMIYVSDDYNNRIQVFQYLSEKYKKASKKNLLITNPQ